MALVIDGGTTGATGSATAGTTGTTVIASGQFSDSTVEILIDKDGGRPAPVCTITAPGAVRLDSPGAKVVANVVGGSSTADIDVVIE